MDQRFLRLLILEKLADGRLPHAYVWDVERQIPGREPSVRLPARSAFRAFQRPSDAARPCGQLCVP